jgi:hypothetical protein
MDIQQAHSPDEILRNPGHRCAGIPRFGSRFIWVAVPKNLTKVV